MSNRCLDRGYDGLADSYDQRRFRGSAGEFNARRDAAILTDYVGRTGAKTVLDVPVGTGRTAEYLTAMGIDVVGCDLSHDMLDVARQKKEKYSLKLNLIRYDASRMPFADARIDCLICLRFFHLFSQADRLVFMKEFHRVVKPGGFLILSATNAFYGLGINLLRRVTGHFGITFLWPGQSEKLFVGWKVAAACGNYLPLQRLIGHRWPGVESGLEGLLGRQPWNSLCFEKFFLLRKENGRG